MWAEPATISNLLQFACRVSEPSQESQMVLLRNFCAAALIAAIVSVGSTRATRADDKKDKDEGWIQLFNGKDFTGWKIPDPPSNSFVKGIKEVKNDEGKVIAFVAKEVDRKVKGKDEAIPGKEYTLWQIKDGMIVGG